MGDFLENIWYAVLVVIGLALIIGVGLGVLLSWLL
jgi:hypothetical protein